MCHCSWVTERKIVEDRRFNSNQILTINVTTKLSKLSFREARKHIQSDPAIKKKKELIPLNRQEKKWEGIQIKIARQMENKHAYWTSTD